MLFDGLKVFKQEWKTECEMQGYEYLTAMPLKIQVFWDIMPS
jgi:hypothetical protein